VSFKKGHSRRRSPKNTKRGRGGGKKGERVDVGGTKTNQTCWYRRPRGEMTERDLGTHSGERKVKKKRKNHRVGEKFAHFVEYPNPETADL